MFRDRVDAGFQLAAKIHGRKLKNPLVLAIPRGGVVTGAVLAQELNAQLDVVLVRKLRSLNQPELAIGAVSEDGFVVFDPENEHAHCAANGYVAEERRHQLAELARRQQTIRAVCRRASIRDRSIIVTDDGIATGSTMIAALQTIRAEKPFELIAAIPVLPAGRVKHVRQNCDDLVYLSSPPDFIAVSQFYEDFSEITDEQVLRLLRECGCRKVQSEEFDNTPVATLTK